LALPKVSVLSLGGTISSVNTGGPGVRPSLTGEALVEAVPGLSEVAEVSAASVRQVPGWQLTVEDLIEVSEEATRAIDEGATGVVVTQGTDSIEETAFALDLLIDRDAPVVVTGAMRNPTLPGADGPANLLAAVTVAADGAACGLGALVVMNDEVHAARFVRKTHTQSPAAFRSPLAGPLGWISEGRASIVARPMGRRHVRPRGGGAEDVALLATFPGDDGRLVGAVGERGYSGLVVEALGGGHVPPPMVEPLAALAERMPVVLASRTGSGEVLRGTYDPPGSEMDLTGRGLIPAGMLDGPKARLFLALLLRSGASRAEIVEAFGHPYV
jgi:L-asparaginase